MRLLSIRLIVSLIVGITLVSISSSYYERNVCQSPLRASTFRALESRLDAGGYRSRPAERRQAAAEEHLCRFLGNIICGEDARPSISAEEPTNPSRSACDGHATRKV